MWKKGRRTIKRKNSEFDSPLRLTTLEKRGKFKAFAELIQILNHKRGLHIVVMYLVVGHWRMPWAFRTWRGKDTTTPAQLG